MGLEDVSAWGQWLEKVSVERDERVYPMLFEDIADEWLPLTMESFAGFGTEQVDPRWLASGVLECRPAAARPNWLYVTSGLSNPWDDVPAAPEGGSRYSGLGVELVMQTPDQAPWAASLLQSLSALQFLTSYRRLTGEPLEYGDRIALGRRLDPTRPCSLSALFVTAPSDFASSFELESGRVDLLLCVGISDAEAQFGTANGSDALLGRLLSGGAYPVTDSSRASVRLVELHTSSQPTG